MLQLNKIKLPDSIEVSGSFYPIKTDFRTWLTFGEILSDKNSKLIEILFVFEKRIPEDLPKAFEELMKFYNPPHELPRPSKMDSSDKILDYTLDADLIYSAFLEQYKIDLLATDSKGKAKNNLHWHQFQALLSGLHDTKLNKIMEYRSYNPNDKTTFEQQMKNLKKSWQLPQNRELSEATKEFNSLFKK